MTVGNEKSWETIVVRCFRGLFYINMLSRVDPDSSSENRTSGIRRCDTHKALDQCGPNERCVQNSKDEEPQCMCQIGYELENGQCIHLATTTMVSITTVQSDVKVDSGGT